MGLQIDLACQKISRAGLAWLEVQQVTIPGIYHVTNIRSLLCLPNRYSFYWNFIESANLSDV